MAELTAEQRTQVQEEVKQTMVAQQSKLLEIAGKNALELLMQHQKKLAPSLLDTIDEEILKTKDKEHSWKSLINERNHSTLREIELMWNRTERFVETLEVPPGQEEIKTGALSFIAKGKKITHERLKVIRFADRDGWAAALNYLGDDIAETEAEAKAMKKGKKEADQKQDSQRGRSDARYNPYPSRGQARSYQSSSSSRDQDRYRGYSSYARNDRSRNSWKQCYECGRMGHIARDCDRR